MRISTCLILLLLCPFIALQAQFETNYAPLVSKGTLPKDFVTLSSQKYRDAKSQLTDKEHSTKKTKEKFLLQSSFGIDNILLSGKVLFNDPMSDYVNKVADNALASEPELRKQLRFYVLKSTHVNAFSTNEGVVLVTTGLLAQLENEAQLAFILCHESIHYKAKHAITEYLEADKIEKGKGAYEQLDREEKFTAKCSFSKEEEKEADEKGLQIFLQSKYTTANLIGVYDVLKYAYLPFDDLVFDKKFLENSSLKFPDNYYKSKTQAIDTKEILDEDPRSTHPSVKSRRDKTEVGIKDADNKGKSDYLVSEAEFKNVRELARFELCRLYTLHRHYEMGIYTSYLLLKKYPNNLYLKKNVAYCLAGLSAYSNEGDFTKVHFNSDSVEGKAQALFYLMYKLDSTGNGALNVVALAYATKLRNDYPNDGEVDEVYKNLMHSLVKTNRLNYSDFSASAYVAPDTTPVIIDTTKKAPPPQEQTEQSDEGKSKYEKLRAQKTEDQVKSKSDPRFTTFAFVDYMKKDWFKNDFEKAADSKKDKKKITIDEAINGRRNYWDKRTYALGIDKIVIVDPWFSRIDARKKEKYKYLESEGGQLDFAARLKSNADKAKLEVSVVNSKNLGENECDKLNELEELSEYIDERLREDKDIDVPYCERERIKAIAQKYGTDYFMWTGTISLTDRNRFRGANIAWSILFPPAMAFTLPPLINGGQYTLYFAVVFDVKTDEVKMATYREINNRTKGYMLNSHLYDVFSQVKSVDKHKSKLKTDDEK